MKFSIKNLWALSLVALACTNNSGNTTTPPVVPPGAIGYVSAPAFPNLKFNDPVELVNAADGSNRLFVVEQAGIIRSFDATTDAKSAALFLDITGKVKSGGEMGLLGLAFHPDFKTNGLFFVNYTRDNPRQSVIARYKVNDPANGVADPQSEKILLTYDQPYANHNGGTMHFGPDGFLYIGTGDGGSGGDPKNNAQDKTSFLGKILRIDVNSNVDGKNYGIPSTNPFVNHQNDDLKEIYAYGMRNPWRMSFDPATKKLWVGDVGQNAIEEIDIIVSGGNYGWRLKEADKCYNPKNNCQQPGLIDPVLQYPHTENNISITGGYVYRGKKLPGLVGKYVYGDYVSGRVWALEIPDNGPAKNALLVERVGSISTFGVDEQNELYIVNYSDGKLYQLKAK